MNALRRTLFLSLCFTLAAPALAMDNRERLEAEAQAENDLLNSHMVSLAIKSAAAGTLLYLGNARTHEVWNAAQDLRSARRQDFATFITPEQKASMLSLAEEEVSEARKHLLETQTGRAPGNSMAQAERRMSQANLELERVKSLPAVTPERLARLKAEQPDIIKSREAALKAAKSSGSWARFGFRVMANAAGVMILTDAVLEVTYLYYGYNSYSPLLDLVMPSAPTAVNSDALEP